LNILKLMNQQKATNATHPAKGHPIPSSTALSKQNDSITLWLGAHLLCVGGAMPADESQLPPHLLNSYSAAWQA